MHTLFGSDEFLDRVGLTKLLVRLLVDLCTLLAILWGVYRRRHGRVEYLFTFCALNVLTFTLCFLLRKVPMDVGMGLGLFAVFGILRYRTEAISTRELTYLFVVIGVGIVNGTANRGISVAEVLTANGAVWLAAFALDGVRWNRPELAHAVLYDRVDLIAPGKRAELLSDLSARLGVPVQRVDLARVDLLKDTVELTAFSSDDPAGPQGRA
jgi:hypothetical protein